MNIKDMKKGTRYRITFEGECTGTAAVSLVGVKPDGLAYGSHILRENVDYVIEELSPPEPGHMNVIMMISEWAPKMVWTYTFYEGFWRSGSMKDTWESLLKVAERNGHTIKIYRLEEVK